MNYLQKNKNLIFYIILSISVICFLYLNFINWQSGKISNGEVGVKYWLDTERYIGGADKIINGDDLTGRDYHYTGYMMILALIQIMNLPSESIVIIQISFALFAAYLLFDIGKLLTNSKIAGLVAVALFLCNPFIVKWHLYILTESLYTSFVVISFWSFAKVLTTKKLKYYLVSIAILLITMSLRPNGWILLPIYIIVVIISLKISNKYKILSGIGAFGIFVLLLSFVPVFNKNIQLTSPVDNLQKGVTVWGHDELNIEMPQEPEIDKSNWTSGFEYVIKHPLASIKLASYRAGYTLIHVRPFHSTGYKLRVLFWIIPAYIFAFIGLWFYRKNKLGLTGILIIAGHLLVIILSYAEHDSRFDIYVLPVFYLFAGGGIASIKNLLEFKLRIKRIKSE
ncbi:MAG TPA: glycosyltransferase family 39 protein [Bacteroidales bacterium]|nr:glycosyltransferase family 39 protein [Bacteroidales bacterium]